MLAPFLGFGTDGDVISSANGDINSVRQSCSITSGSKSLTVEDSSQFSVDDIVYIHKTRGNTTTSCGRNYQAYVTAKPDSTTLTLHMNAPYTFNDSGADQSQIIKIKQMRNWKINGGVTITGTSWNQNKGGIIYVKCAGLVDLDGILQIIGGNGLSGGDNTAGATTGGFRGGRADHQNPSASDTGEGDVGDSTTSTLDNGTGGGGQSTSGPSGGSPGQEGHNNSDADLDAIAQFGGGGGGGANDGSEGGNAVGSGASGGGLIFIDCYQLDLAGYIYAYGAEGGTVSSQAGESSVGGASAGGGIRIRCFKANIGTDLIRANGGLNGLNSVGGVRYGSVGDKGYIRIEAGEVTGSISSTYGNISIAQGNFPWLSKLGFI